MLFIFNIMYKVIIFFYTFAGKYYNMFKNLLFFLVLCSFSMFSQEFSEQIDYATLVEWSKPYRGWHYYSDPVIDSDYNIPDYNDFHSFDVPAVYQLNEQPGIWYMSFIGYNGLGYNSFVAESKDLIHWTNPKLAMGFGKKGEFDYGGRVVGAYLYEDLDVKAPRILKKKDDKYWTLYGSYPRQGEYELRPGYEGVAVSDDGLSWQRISDMPVLSVYQHDTKQWEEDCIYQPWLVEHNGTYYNFYNAANKGVEQSGIAFSNDLIHWVRYPFNPVLRNRANWYDEDFSSDPKVFRDRDHWTMIYFGVSWKRGGSCIMIAFSRDLIHWTADPEPLYLMGGHPKGFDKEHAHKISLIYNPLNETFYMYYCAVGVRGRTICLLTSKPLDK
jgi:predicted GH43/DUF377 family glycosyl hydrolase